MRADTYNVKQRVYRSALYALRQRHPDEFSTIYAEMLAKVGLRPGNDEHLSAEDRSRAVEMRRAGATYAVIAEQLGVTMQAIHQLIQRSGECICGVINARHCPLHQS